MGNMNIMNNMPNIMGNMDMQISNENNLLNQFQKNLMNNQDNNEKKLKMNILAQKYLLFF